MNWTILLTTVAAALLPLLPSDLLPQARRDTVRLAPIVVTATRLPTAAGSLASAVTVLQGDEMRSRGLLTVADALEEVPGAAVVRTGSFGGATSIFLRGGESDYVRVLVDGVPLNQPGGAVDLANLSLDNVERIEVVRGPASVQWGSDAVTGVVHILTRRGAGGPRSEATARAGTYGTTDIGAAASVGGGPLGVALAASRLSSGGMHRINSDYRNWTASGQVHAAPDHVTDVRLSARFGDGLFHYPTDGSGAIADSNQFQVARSAVLGAEAGRFVSSRVDARVLVGLHAAELRISDEPDGPGDSLGLYAYRSRTRTRRMLADGHVNVRLDRAGTVTAGVAFERLTEVGSNDYESSFGPGGGGTDLARGSRAGYLQWQIESRRGVAAQAGVRVDDNETFGTFLTWRIGISARVAPGTRIRAAAGTAFKEPSFLENFASGFVTGNRDLRPERSRSVEAGVEQTALDGRLAVALTLYDQRFANLIQFTYAPPSPGGANYFNVGAVAASGIEFEARYAVSGALSLTGRWSHTRTTASDSGFDGAQFAEGERLLRRPTHSASLAANGAGTRGTAHLSLTWVGERDDMDFGTFPFARVRLPAHLRLDASVSAAVTNDITATLRLENLLNESYQEVYGFPARGRTLLVGGRVVMR